MERDADRTRVMDTEADESVQVLELDTEGCSECVEDRLSDALKDGVIVAREG